MLTSNNPVVRDGIVYDQFLPSISIGPVQKSDGFSVGISCMLQFYAIDATGTHILEQPKIAFVIGDAAQEQDSAAQMFISGLKELAQKFIDTKGI